MLWEKFARSLLPLAVLLAAGSCRAVDQENQKHGTDPGASGVGGPGGGARRLSRIQHGQCTYTFILPENEGGGPSCQEGRGAGQHSANSLQRDAPQGEHDFSSQKIQHLEHVMENYTQWLQKIENYIRESMRLEMAQQQNSVYNHTVAMLEMGHRLFSQTSKLTDVETQVLNQTSRLEIQLLENLLSTNKLEKELLVQMNEISKLQDKNRLLERKIEEMESWHSEELESLQKEKLSLQELVSNQSRVIQELEAQLSRATGNSSAVQRRQQDLMDTVHSLLNLCAREGVIPNSTKQTEDDRKFRDCADLFKAGFKKNGVYTVYVGALEAKKVYCNMESVGGGWTVIQHRENGSVDFQKMWEDYKVGFGSASGEHWLGNEIVFLLTSQRPHTLRVEVTDWEGRNAFSQFDRFHLDGEKQQYRLHIKNHSGTAGKQSSLALHGAGFSTKDMDNDNCLCKCALLLTGGWWFDACGPSNLNGIYYSQGQHLGKINGVKWHYYRGAGYSLRASTMMIRPSDF